jgi:hypothetical protein
MTGEEVRFLMGRGRDVLLWILGCSWDGLEYFIFVNSGLFRIQLRQ